MVLLINNCSIVIVDIFLFSEVVGKYLGFRRVAKSYVSHYSLQPTLGRECS